MRLVVHMLLFPLCLTSAEDPMEVAEEPEPVRLPPDDALLRPLRRSGTGTGEPDEQPAPPAPPPPADDGADAMDTGNDEVRGICRTETCAWARRLGGTAGRQHSTLKRTCPCAAWPGPCSS